jgi:hypothetical protein
LSPGQSTLITAYGFDRDNNLLSVSMDLIPVSGESGHLLYDDGTHGDSLAYDHVYSTLIIIPSTAPYGACQLTITAVDSTGKQDQTQVTLEIIP